MPPTRTASSLSAKMGSCKTAAITSDIITTFKNTKDFPGFVSASELDLKMNLRKKEKAQGSMHDFKGFELSRADVCPNGNYIAVGTDNPEATQQFLSIVDVRKWVGDLRSDPVQIYTSVKEHLPDVRWLDSETLLAATGKGNLKIFHFDSNAQSIKYIGTMRDACSSYIREIAVQPGKPSNIAIGGFSSKLSFIDLTRPDNPYTQRLDMQSPIGNIKWSPFLGASYVSCGLDDGKFYLFDTRSKITQAAFFINTRKEDLFTHERYSDFGVMLGYGDGEMKHLDIRQFNKVLHVLKDPFVDAIGGIEYNDESRAFVVSGYTDMTVWKLKGGHASVLSHRSLGPKALRGKGYTCTATWYDSNTVVTSDNVGAVTVFNQEFDV